MIETAKVNHRGPLAEHVQKSAFRIELDSEGHQIRLVTSVEKADWRKDHIDQQAMVPAVMN